MPPMTPAAFKAQQHQHNYSTLNGGQGPPTGFGGFDVNYNPATSDLVITTKMYMDYQPAPGPGGVQWTGANQTSFGQAFQGKAAEFWSKKRAFRCTLAGFTDLRAIPRLDIQFVGAAALAHFAVRVYPGAGQSHLEQDGSLVLYSLDVHSNYERKKKEAKTDPNVKWYQRKYKWARRQVALSASVGAVLMSEAAKFRAALAANATINFAPGASALTAPESAKLTTIAQTIARAHPDDPQFPLVITGFHTAADGAAVGRARAKACLTALTRAGVRREMEAAATVTADANKQNTATVDFDDSVAAIPNLVLKGQYKYNYTIAIHEFGHVLGLPDEYMLYNSPGYRLAIQNSHTTWANLCAAAGVPNNPYGNGPQYMTNSIMSHGTIISDCHYVMMRDALVHATDHTIPAANWQIYAP